jgi:glutamate carboxypeptidase
MIIDTHSLNAFFEAQLPPGLEMLRQMVSINSFTSNCDGVNRLGKLTADYFTPLGFQPEYVPSSNSEWGNHLVLTRPGRSNKSLAMVSHLDTVFPPEEEVANHFHWQVEGDHIYGPGTLDIKGGTLMMWLVLTALRAKAPELFEEVTWKLFWNSSEECLSPDFEHVCRSRLPAGTVAVLIFEAENRLGPNRLIVAARKGRITWKVTVKGRGAHAGGNLKHGASAVTQLANLVHRIEGMTEFSKELTFNVGRVSGGTVLNRVPHEAVAEGEFRAFSPTICNEAKAQLLALAGKGDVRSRADGYACEVFVEITSESRPWPRNPATDRLLALWADSGRELGTSVMAEERGGLSDGNSFWDFAPTLDGLGPWGDNDHCSERSPDGTKVPEFVELSSFIPKAILNTVSILRLLS